MCAYQGQYGTVKKETNAITVYDTFNNIKEMLGLPRKFYIETRKHLGHIIIFYSELAKKDVFKYIV